MKIVDRNTFLALPVGTVYAKYAPSVFEEMLVKEDTLYDGNGNAIDWFYQDIGPSAIVALDSSEWSALLDESQETGKEIPMDFNIQSRDGCYEVDQLFAVFSPDDVRKLIARLTRCVIDGSDGDSGKMENN